MCDVVGWHDQSIKAIVVEDFVQTLGTADTLV